MPADELDGPPVAVLPSVEPGDELELFFDRYNESYDETPQSPIQVTAVAVETRELTAETDLLPGSLRSITLTVPEDDETASTYWIEHRTEYEDEEERQSVSALLYENEMFSAMTTTGEVGHIDRVVVHREAE
ncbi:hypothetical protein [Halovivax cerinus]|uniref:Uncharacterized protein n=1 Tax=Halovivax cerinus TaxID=1487865 RepID=A0ABD5NSC9_9EURY|nr:hypothetical protein [Halovivax cerinus]